MAAAAAEANRLQAGAHKSVTFCASITNTKDLIPKVPIVR